MDETMLQTNDPDMKLTSVKGSINIDMDNSDDNILAMKGNPLESIKAGYWDQQMSLRAS